MYLPGVETPARIAFRLQFQIKEKENFLDFDWSADETARIFLDGERLTEGPTPGTPERWNLEHAKINLKTGPHTLVAIITIFGNMAQAACMSIQPGFYCSLPGNWEAKVIQGCVYTAPWPDWGNMPRIHTTAEFEPGIEAGDGTNWFPVSFREDARFLEKDTLPPQKYLPVTAWQQKGDVVHFDDYFCVWSEYRFSGTGTIRLRWSETPYLMPWFNISDLKSDKGRRDGSFFFGEWDEFTLNGRPFRWFDPQWRAGRYLEIQCTGTAHVDEMRFFETGYQYPSPPALPKSLPEKYRKLYSMALRTLECCSHETFMDCPFYERMQYIGDARIEALCAYAAFGDWQLPYHALRQYADSQQQDGSIPARYPARVYQRIPIFVMNFPMMLYDFALWNPDRKDQVLELLPAVRRAAEYLAGCVKKGLLQLPGWNFVDWEWRDRGMPNSDPDGSSSILNLFAALAFRRIAQLENWIGNDGARFAELAESLYSEARRSFYDPVTKAFADNSTHKSYSEHAQVLAYLFRPESELIDFCIKTRCMTRCGIFFSFYYFEMCYAAGRRDLFTERLQKYIALTELGLCTLPEEFLMPRSDCHAWSSHFLYHFHASMLGCRPISLGEKVSVHSPLFPDLLLQK